MKHKEYDELAHGENAGDGSNSLNSAFPIPPMPMPFPILQGVSGLYESKFCIKFPIPLPIPLPQIPKIPIPDPGPGGFEQEHDLMDINQNEKSICFSREELRLDVDGRYPQMTASGVIYNGIASKLHWVAEVKKFKPNNYIGKIWYKKGDEALLPHTAISITTVNSFFINQKKATVQFSGFGGAPVKSVTYNYVSQYFHPVEFEFDRASNAPIVTSINTGDHPNHPAGLPHENLTLENVYRRAGFDVTKSGGDDVIPIAEAGVNATWSDMEMHDAMQKYWSKFANKAQWSMWVLFASLSDSGNNLGGIMFDSIGPNHRQGTAIFGNAFISQAPVGDAAPDAWVSRMRFWTAAHEMGHAFNLAHSWQKALGTPWIPLQNDNEARSFMNYPYNVAGGQTKFFSDFEFRFTDRELLFMRHAPMEYVQMGNANWFDNHGFRQADVSNYPDYELSIKVNRNKAVFEFLEPVILELKLKNISSEVRTIDKEMLEAGHEMIVIVKKLGSNAKIWSPFAKYCSAPEKIILMPNDSIFNAYNISSGLSGWNISEPGSYIIQVAVKDGENDIVSNPLQIRIASPKVHDEEYLAQDFFTEDVGRVISFSGTKFLSSANDTLNEVVERMPESRAAVHAKYALSNPLTRKFKELNLTKKKAFDVTSTSPDKAKKEMDSVLMKNSALAVETLGHIHYKKHVDSYCKFLHGSGSSKAASDTQTALKKVMTDRKVKNSVIGEIQAAIETYSTVAGKKG